MAKFKDYEQVAKEYKMGGDDWFNLEDGENRVRITTELIEKVTHYIKGENKQYFCGGEFCEFCLEGNKNRVQFVGWIIDRKDGQFKLASFSYSVFKAIGLLATSTDYGFEDLPPYDLIITKTGKDLETRYTVMPSRKDTLLTEEEKAKLKELNDPKKILVKMKEKTPPKIVKVNEKAVIDAEYNVIPVVEPDPNEENPIELEDFSF